jgi:hypothetical protein
MAPGRRSCIVTATMVKQRETQAKAIQAAVGPSAEIRRLEAHISELLAAIRQRDLVIAGLRRQLDDLECEEEGSGSEER